MVMGPGVCVFDYGVGNVRSVSRALEHAGARVRLESDPQVVLRADGLVVPGVGAFGAVMRALVAVGGDDLIRRRLFDAKPVLGICVGLQILFEQGKEGGNHEGLGVWDGDVEPLRAKRVPHMGWNTLEPAPGSELFAGVGSERFYFVHSYAVAHAPTRGVDKPLATMSRYAHPFVAAIEDGPCCATQFHPEKSGRAGAVVLSRWLRSLSR